MFTRNYKFSGYFFGTFNLYVYAQVYTKQIYFKTNVMRLHCHKLLFSFMEEASWGPLFIVGRLSLVLKYCHEFFVLDIILSDLPSLYIFTAHKRSLRRLCFHRCLSVRWGGVYLWSGGSATPLWADPQADTPLAR